MCVSQWVCVRLGKSMWLFKTFSMSVNIKLEVYKIKMENGLVVRVQGSDLLLPLSWAGRGLRCLCERACHTLCNCPILVKLMNCLNGKFIENRELLLKANLNA